MFFAGFLINPHYMSGGSLFWFHGLYFHTALFYLRMKYKHIILFLFLAGVLISLFYLLLHAIEKQMGDILIIMISGFLLADIVFIIKYFLQFMKPPSQSF